MKFPICYTDKVTFWKGKGLKRKAAMFWVRLHMMAANFRAMQHQGTWKSREVTPSAAGYKNCREMGLLHKQRGSPQNRGDVRQVAQGDVVNLGEF